jgi:hypothetical protein
MFDMEGRLSVRENHITRFGSRKNASAGAIVGVTHFLKYYFLARGEDLTLRADLHIISAGAHVESDSNYLVSP